MYRNTLNKKEQTSSILIIGAGSFGVALASSLYNTQNEIHFLSRQEYQNLSIVSEEQTQLLINKKTFQTFEQFDGNLFKFDLIIFAIPTQALREVLIFLKEKFLTFRLKSENDKLIEKKLFFVSTCKGIEQNFIKLPHEIFQDIWSDSEMSVAALSGPSFAKEMLLKLPTCLTIASNDNNLIQTAISIMHSAHFRLYDSRDIVGVEIGGALKNVIALLSGMIDGLNLGHNAQAAIITLGLSDIAQIGAKMGASPFTFMGLSGLGDLILTCTGPLSRNKQFGYRFACGETKEHLLRNIDGVVEGLSTTKSAYALIQKLGVQSILFTLAYQILYEDLPLQEAIDVILNHEQGSEFYWLKNSSL